MAHSLWPKVKLQIPPLRFGRDDKVEGGYLLGHWLVGSTRKREIAFFRSL